MRFHKNFIFALFIILSFFLVSCDDDPVTPQEEHFEAVGLVLFSNSNEIARIYKGETTDTVFVNFNEVFENINVKFLNEEKEILETPTDEHTELAWEIDDPSIVSISNLNETSSFNIEFTGLKAGTTLVEFFIQHEGHNDFRSGKIPFKVLD